MRLHVSGACRGRGGGGPGAWRGRPGASGLYPWRISWRIIGGSLIAAVLLLALPLFALAAVALVYPILLMVMLLWPSGGAVAIERWREIAAVLSGPDVLAS